MAQQPHPGPSLATYLIIYVVLLVLLVVTVAVAYVPLGSFTTLAGREVYWNTPAALLIAFIKAALVVLFFMHVRYGSRLTWLVAAAGFVWLAILFSLTLSDYLTRLWPMA